MSNPFYLPASHYKRDLNFVEGSIRDAATYIHLQTGDPLDQCIEFVKQTLRPDGAHPLQSPPTRILNKNPEGDREVKTVNFMQFVNRVQKQDLLLSPSMTAYMPESKRRSTHAQYIEEGVKNRKKVKGEMFDAERAGNKDMYIFKKGAQNNLKINNNSYSGATVSAATILHYKSTHSSLTSTCRTATSYANASNEKFIAGNRHYYDPEITKANLIAIINNSDITLIDQVCKRLGLKYPTAEDVLEMVIYSSNNYWQSQEQKALILKLAEGATPAQRAAMLYVGDLYQLYNHNKAIITDFLLKLSAVDESKQPVEDATFKSYDGDLKLLATFLCYEQVKGRDINQLINGDPKQDPPLAPEPEVYDLLKATTKHASDVLMDHQDFLTAFFMTNVMPSSIHAFPSIYRKAVPVSDTDSTMFTLQWWVEQIFGEIVFTAEAKRVVFGLVFLISEVVMHLLALLSTNMGVKEEKLRLLSMKNEYYFAVLNLTTRSKHYYASQDAQEGIMFKKAKQETKGVGLRDSKVPPKINKAAKAMMKEILDTIKAGKKLKITELLTRIANLEREIIQSLLSGQSEYLTTGQIKSLNSYKSEDNATFKQYELWRDVFAPSFGMVQEPPYQVVKVSLAVNNKTDMQDWLEKMNNPALADRFKLWMLQEKKTEIGTLLIPASIVETTNIPKEITCAIDTRRVISNTMGTFYLMLESLGIFLIDKNNTRLVSDFY